MLRRDGLTAFMPIGLRQVGFERLAPRLARPEGVMQLQGRTVPQYLIVQVEPIEGHQATLCCRWGVKLRAAPAKNVLLSHACLDQKLFGHPLCSQRSRVLRPSTAAAGAPPALTASATRVGRASLVDFQHKHAPTLSLERPP
jgi:hypothetical protein